MLRYIQDNADGFRILVRDSNPTSGSGTFASLISDIAGQVEYILGDVLAARGYDPKLAPMYAQMLVGMVAFTGQWWLDARKPKLEEMAAHLVNLAWNGLSALDPKPRLSAEALERLRDSYKMLLADKVIGEADQAVLLAVEITLRNARNARAL